MRIVDLFFAFPFFVLVIAIVAMLGPSIFNMFVAIWLTSWISYARITRGHVVVTQEPRSTCSPRRRSATASIRVMLRHVLPNVLSFVLIFAMVDAVGNVLLGAALGFLGLGAKPPSPEWGAMISDGQAYILTRLVALDAARHRDRDRRRRVQPDRRRPRRRPPRR